MQKRVKAADPNKPKNDDGKGGGAGMVGLMPDGTDLSKLAGLTGQETIDIYLDWKAPEQDKAAFDYLLGAVELDELMEHWENHRKQVINVLYSDW